MTNMSIGQLLRVSEENDGSPAIYAVNAPDGMTVTALVIAVADPVRAQQLPQMVEENMSAEDAEVRRARSVMREYYPEMAADLDAIFARGESNA